MQREPSEHPAQHPVHFKTLPRAVLGLPKPYPVRSSAFSVEPRFKNSWDFRDLGAWLLTGITLLFQIVVSSIAQEEEDGVLK